MNRLIVALLVLFFPTLNACAAKEVFKGHGVEISLLEANGSCQVISSHDQIVKNLLIPWPCNFHQDRTGDIRVYEENGAKYLLVENSVPHPDLAGDCITRLQSIMIKGDIIKISEYKETVASCPPFQWDPFVFTGLFKE